MIRGICTALRHCGADGPATRIAGAFRPCPPCTGLLPLRLPCPDGPLRQTGRGSRRRGTSGWPAASLPPCGSHCGTAGSIMPWQPRCRIIMKTCPLRRCDRRCWTAFCNRPRPPGACPFLRLSPWRCLMPELEINLDALAHNLRLVRRQEQAWGFRFLPVLKMVASHPDVVDFLRTQGYARYGIADMTEHLLYGQEPPARTGRVLINLAPPDRADDVVRLFERSAFSCESTFRALDAAARAAGLHHEALLMVDIGDMREGIPQEDAPALLRAVATASQRAAHGPGAIVAGDRRQSRLPVRDLSGQREHGPARSSGSPGRRPAGTCPAPGQPGREHLLELVRPPSRAWTASAARLHHGIPHGGSPAAWPGHVPGRNPAGRGTSGRISSACRPRCWK